MKNIHGIHSRGLDQSVPVTYSNPKKSGYKNEYISYKTNCSRPYCRDGKYMGVLSETILDWPYDLKSPLPMGDSCPVTSKTQNLRNVEAYDGGGI